MRDIDTGRDTEELLNDIDIMLASATKKREEKRRTIEEAERMLKEAKERAEQRDHRGA